MQIETVRGLADSRDAATLFFDLLKKREHLPAIVGMPDGFHGHGLFTANRDRLSCHTVTGPATAATPWKSHKTTD